MTTTIVAFVVAFLVAVAATPLVRFVAPYVGAIDKPDGFRKIHKRPIPRLGGIAVFLGFFTPLFLLVLFFPDNYLARQILSHGREYAGLIAAATLVLVTGIVDDVRGVRPRTKFALQVAAACIACAAGLRIGGVTNPLSGQPLSLGFLAIPVTLFWYVGAMNGVNLIDGLDGLASGVCLFMVMAMLVVSVLFEQTVSMLLLGALGGAILGFLVYNFYPASIFLGDSGSLLLGFLVAALSLMGSRKSSATVALFIPLIALGLPILDTSVAIVRRWSRRLPMSAADRHHIHHALLKLGLRHKTVVLVLYAACLFLGSLSILVATGDDETLLVVMGSLGVIAFVCVRVLGGIRLRDVIRRVAEDFEQRELRQAAAVSVHRTVQCLQTSTSADDAWRSCREAFEQLGLDQVRLVLLGMDGPANRGYRWVRGRGERGSVTPRSGDSWTGRFTLRGDRGVLGQLDVARYVDDRPFVSDLAVHVRSLAEALSANLGRIYADEQILIEELKERAAAVRETAVIGRRQALTTS